MSAAASPLISALNAAISQAQQQNSQLASVQQQLQTAQATIAVQAAQIAASSTIAPGTDLGPLLAKATAGQTIYLKPGASYPLTGSPIPAAGVSLIGFNTSIVETPVPGGSSGIAVKNPNCTFSGLNFSASAAAVVNALHIWAPGTTVNGCNFDGSLHVGVQTEATAANTTITGCNFAITQAQGVYACSDNLTIQGCTFLGSVGEHPIRIDADEVTGRRPSNASIVDCTVSNHNSAGKEAIAIRECTGVTLANITVPIGYIHIGQGKPDAIVHVTDVIARGLTFGTIRQGPNGTPGGAVLQIEHDVWITATGVTAPGSTTDPLASIDDRGTLNYRNFTETGTPPAAKTWHAMVSGAGKAVAA